MRRRSVVELLTVRGDPRLGTVDWSLDSCDHVQQLGVVVWVSDVVKPRVLKSLFPGESFCWVHFEEANHQAECFL